MNVREPTGAAARRCVGPARGRRPARRRRPGAESTGLTLIELLVATAITGIVLAGAWGWFWSVAQASRREQARSLAQTAAASAARGIAGELTVATGVLATPAGRDPGTSLYLRRSDPSDGDLATLVVWDQARRVVWRNASGTYLADNVSGFTLDYLDAAGKSVIVGAASTAQTLRMVARVRVTLEVTVSGTIAQAVVDQPLGRS